MTTSCICPLCGQNHKKHVKNPIRHLSDKFAFKWLLQFYKPENIEFRPNNTPDFKCSDGKRYEAKLMKNRNKMRPLIEFYDKQDKKMKDEDFVIVFDRNGTLVEKFQWKDRDLTNVFLRMNANC